MSTLQAHLQPLEYSALDEVQFEDGYLARWRYLAVLFAIPTLFCGLSWVMGGVAFLTDAAFLLLTILCLSGLLREMVVFPKRFGIGGILLFGGVLVWFSHDYLWNWFAKSRSEFEDKGIPVWV